MTPEEFVEALDAKGINLDSRQIQQFESYYQFLVEWNQKINLTAITDQKEVYLKHFYDSLAPLWLTDKIQADKALIDIGAGAGFPSIPLAIAQPGLRVTIVDSLNKRIKFLEVLVEALGLDQVQALHGRAEDLGQDKRYRQNFDLVTARAVAQLNVLAEYCLPFAKKGGYFLALKAQKTQTEIDQAQAAIKVLGAKLEDVLSDVLPGQGDERTIVVIKKTLDTPNKYPRKAGKPAKQPLK